MSRSSKNSKDKIATFGLSSKELVWVSSIIDRNSSGSPGGAVWIFGSRARGDYRPYSDVDLLFSSEFSPMQLRQIRDALDESNLPYKFDVVGNSTLEPSYRESVEHEKKIFWTHHEGK